MNTITKQILWGIKFGRPLMMVETVDRVFLADWVSKYSVSGYVCGIIGDYKSNFKQVSIQTNKRGERFIMADRIKFNADKFVPAEISREILEKELASCKGIKEMYVQMKNDGEDVGHSIENEEFYIKNLTEYMKGVV